MQDYDDRALDDHAQRETEEAKLAEAFDEFQAGTYRVLKRTCLNQLESGSFLAQTLPVGESQNKTYIEAEMPGCEIFIDCVLLDPQNNKLLSELLASDAADRLRLAIAHAYAEKEAYPIARARSVK